MPAQVRIYGFLPLIQRSNGKQSGRFLHNKDIGVFIENFQAVGELCGSPPRPDFQNISGLNPVRGNAAGNAVYSDATL